MNGRLEPEFANAGLEDVDLLVAVHALAFQSEEERYGHGPPGYRDREWHVRALRKKTYIKIIWEGQIVGGMIVEDRGAGDFFLEFLYIHPAFQSKGFGQKAMEHLERSYPAAQTWQLLTPYRDTRNHRFYERLGYQKIGEIAVRDHPVDPEFRLFEYEKKMHQSRSRDR